MDSHHPDEMALSATNRSDDPIELRFFSKNTESKENGEGYVDVEIPPHTQIGLGDVLAYFQKLSEGFCVNPDHPKLYSESEDGYFCPFCNQL